MGFKSDGIRWKWDDKSTTPCSNWQTATTSIDEEELKINANKWKGEFIASSPISDAPMQYGWVCPKCGRVNSPYTSTCWCWALGPNGIPIIKC